MTFSDLIRLWKTDLHRYYGKVTAVLFIRSLLSHPGFKCTFWMRFCNYLHKNNRKFLLIFCRRILRKNQVKYGIEIPYNAEVGEGLYIGHFTGIFVSPQTVIGNNVNLSQCVTIGEVSRGKYKGSPVIKDNVVIAAGAKVVGAITVGNNVIVGNNSVVTKDVPDNSVVGGVPAQVISHKGSDGYILNTNYNF